MLTRLIRAPFARLIDVYNPGVTCLVVIWVAGLSLRRYLAEHEMLTQIRDEALLSLIYVVPIMLIGWGVFALIERPVKS